VAALPADRPLTVPLLVGGSFDNILLVFLGVCCCVLIGIGLAARANPFNRPLALLCWGMAGGVAFLALGLGLWLRQRRQWLEVTLTGFVLSRHDRRRRFGDDQVIGVAQTSRFISSGYIRRRVVLDLAGTEGTEHIDCRYSLPASHPDPLAAFLDRAQQGLARRTAAALAQGARLEGPGWVLDRDGLHRGGAVHPLEQISWVAFLGRRLCLWRGGEERAFLRLSLLSRNVHVLGLVLWQMIQQRPSYLQSPAGLPLGRLLLERGEWATPIGYALMTTAAVAIACFSVYMVAVKVGASNLGPVYVMGGICLGVAGLGGLLCLLGWGNRVRFYERGATQPRRGGDRQLLYKDMGDVTWKQDQSLMLRPWAGVDQSTIRFWAFARKFDFGMITVRNLLCAHIARHWATQLQQGPVQWTGKLRFLPGGLEYRPWVLLGTSEPITVPYHLTSYRLENGLFLLFVSGHSRPACKERLDLPNFFVGLMLLEWIYQANRQAQSAMTGAGQQWAPVLPQVSAPDDRITGTGPAPGGITPQAP
jgi:hypothetical protein